MYIMHFYTCLEDCRILSEPFPAHFWCLNQCTNLNECRSFHINLNAISFISELNLPNLHVKVAVGKMLPHQVSKPKELGLAACEL